jgi:hypothetical protein
MEGVVDYTWTTDETPDLTHVRLIGAGAIGTAVQAIHEVRLLYHAPSFFDCEHPRADLLAPTFSG